MTKVVTAVIVATVLGIALAFAVNAAIVLPSNDVATIGGTEVPALDCEEDEVIGFDGVPDTLVCIQVDDV